MLKKQDKVMTVYLSEAGSCPRLDSEVGSCMQFPGQVVDIDGLFSQL